MADQVNLLGGLALGTAQTLQSMLVASSPKTPTAKPAEARPKAEDRRDIGISKEELESAVKSLEGFLQQSPSNLQFSVDRETGLYFFKIVDPATQETIRQVPTEEILAMAKRLRQLSDVQDASGVLLDKEG